jgi:hypothetical protein
MTLDEAKKVVFETKSVFADLYKKYGEKNWLEYAKENFPKNSSMTETSKEFIIAFEKLLLPLIGREKTDRAIATIEQNGFVSTADHHGVLCHPFFANNALVRSHPSILQPDSSLIMLTCGGISISNSSFPRGIFFHDSNLKENRLLFESLKGRRRSVYGLPSFSKMVIEKEISRLEYFNLNTVAKEKLKKFLEKIKNHEQIFERNKYSDQLTIINDILWSTLFDDTRSNLVYLEAESLVRELLLSVHLKKETYIYKILFDPKYRHAYIKYFENVDGAHNTQKQKGSHFFWYIDETKNIREQLWVIGNNLESIDGRTIISLEANTISKYLLQFKLLPSTAFCYSILGFYYGLTLGGGPFQIQYLGEIKKSYEKTISEFDAAAKKFPVRTDIFTGDLTLIGIGNQTKVLSASLIDSLLYGDANLNNIINNEIESQTVGETLDQMIPEFVTIITGKKETVVDLPDLQKTLNV